MAAMENQNATIYAGDVKSLRFQIEDADGEPAAFTSPVGYYKAASGLSAAERVTPVISKSSPSSGVRMVEETIDTVDWWVAYVDFDEDDTAEIPGVYFHQLRIIDGANKQITASGKLTVKPLIGV